MKTLSIASLVLTATVLSFVAMTSSFAEEGELELVAKGFDGEAADSSSGHLVLRISASSASDANDSNKPTPPVEPTDPSVEDDQDIPTFWGEPVGGATVFILDISDSMRIADSSGSIEDQDGNVILSPARLDVLKIETLKTLSSMSESDSFDIIELAGLDSTSFSGAPEVLDLPVTSSWRGELVNATQDVVDDARAYVLGLTTRFGTPAYSALQRACNTYGAEDVDTLVFHTDGVPSKADIPGMTFVGGWFDGAQDRILGEFGDWFEPMRESGCKLICVQQGEDTNAGNFLQQLAVQNNGVYESR